MGKATFFSPGIDRLPVLNTVFVDYTYGGDATGVVERMDRPFATRAGALAAIALYYVGGNAPSPTNRILVKVWSGYSRNQLICKDCVDYDLSNGVIEFTQASGNYTVTDDGNACDTIIYGNASFYRNGQIALAGGVITVTNAASNIRIQCDQILLNDSNGSGGTILCSGGTATITCNYVGTISDGSMGVYCANNAILTLNVMSTNARGNSIEYLGANGIAVFCQNQPQVTINAVNIFAQTNSDGVYYSADGGYCKVNANINADRFGNVHNGNGTCTITGSIESVNVCVYGQSGGGIQNATGNLRCTGGSSSVVVGNNNDVKVQNIYSPLIEKVNADPTVPIINGSIGTGTTNLYRCKIVASVATLCGIQVPGANNTVVDCTIVTAGADPAFDTTFGAALKIYGTLTDNNAGIGGGGVVVGTEITNAAVT